MLNDRAMSDTFLQINIYIYYFYSDKYVCSISTYTIISRLSLLNIVTFNKNKFFNSHSSFYE